MAEAKVVGQDSLQIDAKDLQPTVLLLASACFKYNSWADENEALWKKKKQLPTRLCRSNAPSGHFAALNLLNARKNTECRHVRKAQAEGLCHVPYTMRRIARSPQLNQIQYLIYTEGGSANLIEMAASLHPAA